MPVKSPKSPVLMSKQAIKRSLKTKLKLIGAENKILVDTINGYVQKAETVYSKLESSSEITPKQFSRAMAKLETVYTACVKLILMAADLFDEDEKSESTSESSTKTSDSVASSALADSDSSAPVEVKANALGKETGKRLKKLESRFHDFVARKEFAAKTGKDVKPSIETGKNPTLPVKPASVSPNRVEFLFGRPDISGDLDNFIEFQRFLYGVDKGEASGEQGVGSSAEKTAAPMVEDSLMLEKHAPRLADKDVVYYQSKSSAKEEDSPETDIQSSIIKKLESLEKAIMKMSRRAPGSDHDLQPTEQHRIEEPCLKNAREKNLDGKIFETTSYRASAQRMPGNVCRQDEVSDFSSTSYSHLTRSPCFRGYYDNGKTTASDLLAESCRKSQHDLTNKFFSSSASTVKPSHYHCPCQHSEMQASDFLKKYQDISQPSGKPHSADKSADVDDSPCKKFQDLYGSPAAREKCLSEQERDDMVHRIVEMVSAQLLPRFSGQLSGAQYLESSQMEASLSNAGSGGLSGRQFKKHRCLSAPNVKWSEAQPNAGSSSLTHVCGGAFQHYLLPKEEAVQVSIRQEESAADGSSYSSVQKQPDPLASQQFFSAQNSQETVDTQSFYSLQQHLQDIRASLENIHNAQRLNSRAAVSAGTLQPYRAVHAGLGSQLARPFNSTPLFTPNKTTETNNSQLLRRGGHPLNGEFFSVETPLTIEIHDYQPLLPSTGIPYLGKNAQVEKEKEQFRKHAKSQMHRLKAQQRQSPYPSPKNENNVTGSGSTSFAYKYGSSDANKLDEEIALAVDDCKLERRDSESLERHVHFHYSHPYKAEGVVAAAATNGTEESSSSNTLVCDDKADLVDAMRMTSAGSKGRGRDDVFQARLELHRSGSRVSEREEGEVAPEYPPYVDSHRLICQGSSHHRQMDDRMSCTKDGGINKGELSKDEDFASQDMYDITNNLSQIQDNEEVKKSRTKNTKTICISNLPLNLEEIRLLYLLKPHGHVTKIYFIKHRTTGAFQGIAYIKFSREEDARAAAKALHKTNVDGQTVFARIHSQGK